MSARITIIWAVPAGYSEGDYAMLFGNGGGEGVGIDYDTPLTNEKFLLFPDGGGIFGWYHAPWGHFAWGHAWATRVAGWYHLPWGHFPWGFGSTIITVLYDVEVCGEYKFALKVFDKLGNANTGSPEELEASIHLAPPAPTGLKKNSYDPDTDILVLDAA
ncbi:MAG TPA: hypothetical protein DD726_06390 [Phycisphaerales bacterium]|nr:hypothetical protein [Phycisphaerales bacterium]